MGHLTRKEIVMTTSAVRLHRVIRAPAERVYRVFLYPDALTLPAQLV